MDDLISRQAAIEAMRKAKDKSDAHRMLLQLPPAQPSVSKEEMVGDTISRQAAIKAICEDGTMLERQGKYTMTMAERKQKDADILDSLPSAQSERPKGEWIYGEHDIAMCDGYWCDQCGFFVPWDYKHKFIDFIKDYHWCPSCGADMRGKQDE